MAADDGLRSGTKRWPRLPVLLGAAIVACTLAFGWVALRPLAERGKEARVQPGVLADNATPSPSAPAASAGPGAAGRVTLSVMTLGNELGPAQIAEFEALNPDIHLVFVEFSSNLLDILLATNDLPDVFRLAQVEHRSLVKRGLLLDLTDRIARSQVVSRADLREDLMADLAVDGRYYGLPQGLATPDFTALYINKTAFAQAGIPLPSLQEPMTYAELAAIAKKLTAKTGRPAFYSFFFERAVAATLAQVGAHMFNDDFSEMTLTRNPKALEVMRYFYDLAVSGAMYVPPATPGIAFLFENGELPISQSGYWMGAVVTPATRAHGQVTMLPPPVWDRKLPRVSAYLGLTTLAVSAATAHPDQAYRFVEWYTAGPPAVERVRRGWGFPLLRSVEPLLPQATDFDKQRLHVALDSLTLPVARLPEYPHPGILPAFNQSWTKNIELAKSGKIDFAEFASNLQEDVNLAIQDDVTSRDDQKPR